MAKDKNLHQEEEQEIKPEETIKPKEKMQVEIKHGNVGIKSINLAGHQHVAEKNKDGKFVFVISMAQAKDIAEHGYSIKPL